MIKLEHYLIVVALLCIAIIILALIPSSYQRPQKPHHVLKNRCDPTKEPVCADPNNIGEPMNATCVLNKKTGKSEWYCDFYRVTDTYLGNIYPRDLGSQSSRINGVSFVDAEQTCENLGDDCGLFQWNTAGWMTYSPANVVNPNIISGYRLLPYKSNLFSRAYSKDLTNVFMTPYTATLNDVVPNLEECENMCAENGGYGYIFDNTDAQGECTVYQSTNQSGTIKYLKNPNL
jgi:hypothetical protein